MFGEPERTWLEMLLTGQPCGQAIAQSSTSFLLARRPRWPIRSILLILRIEKTDEAAVDWLARLAQPGKTAVLQDTISNNISLMLISGGLAKNGPN